MIVKLNRELYEFLNSTLAVEEPELFKNLPNNSESSILISDEVAIAIGDWINERLQKEGFDENYELNESGKLLVQLQDLFFS